MAPCWPARVRSCCRSVRWAPLLFAIIVMTALAAGFSQVVVRRLVGRPAIAAIMVTLGLGMAMRGVAPMLFGETAAVIPRELLDRPTSIAGVPVDLARLVAAVVAALCIAVLGCFYRFSRTGLALRAIADDAQAAMSTGIDVERHLMLAWTLSGVVAVISGTLWTLVSGSGFGLALVGLKVLPIALIGGLDSIAGAIAEAVAIGVLESLGAGYLDERIGSGFGSLVPYVALLLLLTMRLHGLFGRPRIERV